MDRDSQGIKAYFYFIGFGIIFLAFIASSLYSYQRFSELQTELTSLTNNNDIQLRSALNMRVAVRERAILLWHMTLQEDFFERDTLFEEFYTHGSNYQNSRLSLLNTQLTSDEKALLEALDVETSNRAPLLRQFADLLMEESHSSYTQELNQVLSDQIKVADLLDQIIGLQQRQNESVRAQSAIEIQTLFTELITFMIIIISGGFVFAGYVVLNASRQSKMLAVTNKELQHIACHDNLTGLPNRMFLLRQLEIVIARAKRRQSKTAILFIDLDNFKPINDTFGHKVGDKCLQALSTRMQRILRGSDILGRLGGDEFLLVLSDIESAVQAIAVAQKIIEKLGEELLVEGHLLQSSASIGIYIYSDEDVTAEETITLADKAMYQAKKSGKNQFYII